MKWFRIPREHGLIFIWLSTLIYSLLQVKILNLYLLEAIIGSFLILMLSDSMLDHLRKKEFIKFFIGSSLIFLVYLPLLIKSYQKYIFQIILLIVIICTFLIFYNIKPKYYSIIGGVLISMHSYFILFSANVSEYKLFLFPVAYSFIATSQAFLRVKEENKTILYLFYIVSILLLILFIRTVPFYILFIDIILRIYQQISRLNYKIKIKLFGIIEAVRNLLVYSLVSILF